MKKARPATCTTLTFKSVHTTVFPTEILVSKYVLHTQTYCTAMTKYVVIHKLIIKCQYRTHRNPLSAQNLTVLQQQGPIKRSWSSTPIPTTQNSYAAKEGCSKHVYPHF